MNVLVYLCATVFLILLLLIYCSCGEYAIKFWKDVIEPEPMKDSKCRYVIRSIIFILNPIFWILVLFALIIDIFQAHFKKILNNIKQ